MPNSTHLYDSPVGGVLWTSRAVVVAGARAWQFVVTLMTEYLKFNFH